MHRLILYPAILGFATAVCAGPVTSTASSDEQAIHETYKAWVVAANEKDIAEWSTFLAQDPYFSPADSPPLTSTEEVVDYYKKSFADPWFALDCEQEQVHISESGEIAWSYGTCNATLTGPDGEKASGSSRWFKVWIRQADGSWRCRVNTWKYVAG